MHVSKLNTVDNLPLGAMSRHRINWPESVSLLTVVVYLAVALSFWSFTVDDAYISARYALNGSLGRGLVFNVGERVMGYTNLLLVLIEMVVYYLGGDGIFWAKLLGLIAGGFVLWLTVELGRLMSADGSPTMGLLAAALLAVYPYLPLSSVIGLETSLFTALTLAAILFYSQSWLAEQWGWKRQAGLAVLFILATITRPEGLGFVVVLSILQLAAMIGQRTLARRSITQQRGLSWHSLSWSMLYWLLLLPLLIVLTSYYGSPIPNTFWAKTAAGFSWANYVLGSIYLVDWFRDTGFYLLIPLALWPFITRKVLRGGHLIVGAAGFFTIYVLYTGGDWIPGYRFLVPVLPFYFLVASAGMVEIWQTLRSHLAHLSTLGRSTFVLLTFVALLVPSIPGNRSLRDLVAERSAGYEQAHLYIGESLRDETPANATVALMDIGLIGFVSDRYIIDIGGLANREVAMLMHNDRGVISSSPATAQRIAQTVLAKKPDYIILAHNNDPRTEPFTSGWTHDAAIYASPTFQSHYRYIYSRQHQTNYLLSVYKRID